MTSASTANSSGDAPLQGEAPGANSSGSSEVAAENDATAAASHGSKLSFLSALIDGSNRRRLAAAGVCLLGVATIAFTIAGERRVSKIALTTRTAVDAPYAGAAPGLAAAPADPAVIVDSLAEETADSPASEALLAEGATTSLEPALERLKAGEYEKARWLAEPVANSGDPAAQHLVGYLYETGLGGLMDVRRAESFYRRSAQAGNIDAQVSLGILYLEGVDGDAKPELAVKWFRRAAEAGDARAIARLGALYTNGIGVQQDRIAGRSLFEQAAAAGDADALFVLGIAAMNGDGVPQDFQYARQRLEAASAAGHVEAAYNLAVLYRSEALGRPDIKKAAIIMNAAAEAGYAPAMTAMGLYAHRGEAEGAAADWFEKANAAGDLQGRFFYAVALAQGDGREKDAVRAKAIAESVLNDKNADGELKGNVRRFLQSLADGKPTKIGGLRE
ncbi:MAG: tetratricopeptide repeat protein [Pseudomonadota bacterium]